VRRSGGGGKSDLGSADRREAPTKKKHDFDPKLRKAAILLHVLRDGGEEDFGARGLKCTEKREGKKQQMLGSTVRPRGKRVILS